SKCVPTLADSSLPWTGVAMPCLTNSTRHAKHSMAQICCWEHSCRRDQMHWQGSHLSPLIPDSGMSAKCANFPGGVLGTPLLSGQSQELKRQARESIAEHATHSSPFHHKKARPLPLLNLSKEPRKKSIQPPMVKHTINGVLTKGNLLYARHLFP